jgi:hypothetical protein
MASHKWTITGGKRSRYGTQNRSCCVLLFSRPMESMVKQLLHRSGFRALRACEEGSRRTRLSGGRPAV